MSEAIYRHNAERLEELVKQASNADGATLLIPDLQRPFVWDPPRVTLLIDSLIRGWPFGTLLLWAVESSKLEAIPSRAFWRVVDRADAGGGVAELAFNPPGRFRMVLDGQQRMQSLVLALSSDRAGFKLPDRSWFEALEDPRASARSKEQWTFGQLCLDVENYLAQRGSKRTVSEVEYRDALKWVVCSADDGCSQRPTGYKPPLSTASDTPERFIRLSRLWGVARSTKTSEYDYEDVLTDDFLPEQEFDPKGYKELARPLAQLVKALEYVRAADVSFLELRGFDENRGDDRSSYSNAIVNIFTRLNTAGRTLTNQEIIFAWIKTHWPRQEAAGRKADQCFESLRVGLAERDVDVNIDELVQAVSFAWAVLFNAGAALGPRDLLRGEQVGKMAPDLAKRWDRLAGAFLRAAELLQEEEIVYGKHFQSLNSFVVLATWHLLGVEWGAARALNTVHKHSLAKRLDDGLRSSVERWIAITSWAGRWREASAEALQQYALDLAATWKELGGAVRPEDVEEQLKVRMAGWLEAVADKAVAFIQALSVDRRENVRLYFLPLWVWHHLDEKRWELSEVNLPKTRRTPKIEVDHIVSCSYWSKHVTDVSEGDSEGEDSVLNEVGNCILLEKNFNIAKSDRALDDFLSEVYEFSSGKVDRLEWSKLMVLSDALTSPTESDADAVRAAVAARTTTMKDDLVKYIHSKATSVRAVAHLGGTWTSTLVDPEGTVWKVTLNLNQRGRRLNGTYAYKDGSLGELEASIDGDRVRGSWREGKRRSKWTHGRVDFRLADGGTRFTGTWGYQESDAGGTWEGIWVSSGV